MRSQSEQLIMSLGYHKAHLWHQVRAVTEGCPDCFILTWSPALRDQLFMRRQIRGRARLELSHAHGFPQLSSEPQMRVKEEHQDLLLSHLSNLF